MDRIVWSALAVLVGVVTLVLSGCGDGGKTTEEAGSSAHGSPQPGSKAAAPGVPTSTGDDSIQTWGLEASSAERVRLGAMVQTYFDARARADWAQACSQLATEQRRMFEGLFRGRARGAACAKAMGRLARGIPARAFDHEADIRKILSLRLGGGRGFLIYRRPRGVYATAIIREGGNWKVVSVTPATLG